MNDEDPFRAPQSDVGPGAILNDYDRPGLWRDRRLLVLHRHAAPPDRCIACNMSAAGRRWRKKFFWHPRVYYLMILLNPLIYVIVALMIHRSATFDLGICERHERRRRQALVVGLLSAALGILGIDVSVAFLSANIPLLLASSGLLLFGLGFMVVRRRLVGTRRIGDYFVWLKGAHPDYLAEYPAWQDRLTPYTKRRMAPPTRGKARRAKPAAAPGAGLEGRG